MEEQNKNKNNKKDEDNDILTLNKLESKKASIKSQSNKNNIEINEYKELKDLDLNQVKEDEEQDLRIKEENPIMNGKNQSMDSDEMEMDEHYLTDPIQSKSLIFYYFFLNIFKIKFWNL